MSALLYIITTISIVISSFTTSCYAISDITKSSFDLNVVGVIAAFGDFNSDELTDAFVITNNSNIVIYLADSTEPFLRPSVFSCNFTDLIVTSVVPGDFDGDAYMDILITTQSLNAEDLHQVRVIWGGSNEINCSDAQSIKLTSKGQPLVLDYNRDMTLDLFGLNTKGERVFWVFDRLRLIPQEIPLPSQHNEISKEIKLPHSHSFLDMNNDNAADLLITTKVDIEVWLSDPQVQFKYNYSIDLLIGSPAIYGQALFTDLTLSGQFDLVIPVCYDIQCHNSTILIYANGEYTKWHDLRVDFNDGTGTQWRFVPPRDEVYLDTISMRAGDFNMDGYADLLMTLSPINSNDTKVFLLHNIPCSAPSCTFHRTFKVQWDLFQAFGNNVVMATFYDFYMDGVLDIIYVKKNKTTNQYTMNAYKNILEYDTNFIKVIVSTGLTNKIIPTINRTLYRQTVTFGTNLPGPRISYDTWSQEGTYRTAVCAQLSQSAYFSLQLPYSIFGLDRSPNFVETLYVGLSGYSKSWTQIIPNSQIIVIPNPPSDPTQWKAQLFVTPSKVIMYSVFVVAAILLVNFGLVVCLHCRERHERQDVMEIDDKTYIRI